MAKKKRDLPDSNDNEAFEAYRKRFIIASLRRGTLFWGYRNEALKRARVERGMYICNVCKKIYPKKETQIDHINPVVKLGGFQDWNQYFDSMFCKTEGFQILCKPCHTLKSQEENLLRKIARQAKKNNTK